MVNMERIWRFWFRYEILNYVE